MVDEPEIQPVDADADPVRRERVACAPPERPTVTLDDLARIATSAVFHFFCCGEGVATEDPCGELVPAMARLARAVAFRSDPATDAEIAGVPIKVLDGDLSTSPSVTPSEDAH